MYFTEGRTKYVLVFLWTPITTYDFPGGGGGGGGLDFLNRPLPLDPPMGDFCRQLVTFSYSLDPDQSLQNVGPDQDSN